MNCCRNSILRRGPFFGQIQFTQDFLHHQGLKPFIRFERSILYNPLKSFWAEQVSFRHSKLSKPLKIQTKEWHSICSTKYNKNKGCHMKHVLGLFITFMSITTFSYAQSISLDQLFTENPSVTAHEKFNETYELAGLGFGGAQEHRYSLFMNASSCTQGVTFFIDFPNHGIENQSYLKQSRALSKIENEQATTSLMILILSGKAMQAGNKSLSKKFMKKLKKVCDISSNEDAEKFGKDLLPLLKSLQSIDTSSEVTASTSDRVSGKEVNESSSNETHSASGSRASQQ